MIYCKFFIFIYWIVLLYPTVSLANNKVFDVNIRQQIIRHFKIDKKDIIQYKKIFKAVDNNDFAKTDELIEDLEDDSLIGTILAKKYLSSKYNSSIEELENWLNTYSDFPQKKQIEKLFKQKSQQNVTYSRTDNWLLTAKISPKYLSKLSIKDKNFLVKSIKNFRKHISKGKTLNARKILENKYLQKITPKPYWDNLAATLATKYFVDNYDSLALTWGKKASMRHNSGMATWIAGLASWRLKKYKLAASYFERLGNSKNADKWLVASGAYWAYRAYTKIGNDIKAQEMLLKASTHKYTFYGILAAYQLGIDLDFSFTQSSHLNDYSSPEVIDNLAQSTSLKRIAMLMEIKQNKLAQQEALHIYPSLNSVQKEALILMAHQRNLHSLVIAISKQPNFEEISHRYEKEIYPLPLWSNQKNWEIDKALLLALIRQESAFNNDATSQSGAKGLMQLMPQTASYISKDKTLRKNQSKLYDTKYNLKLGQKYINYLFNKPFVDGNLFFMLTAYNAGPGNLAKWQKKSRFQGDPLLFIEVIPSSETRIYIERVMANYWIYNIRIQNDNPTIEQISNGNWPIVPGFESTLFN